MNINRLTEVVGDVTLAGGSIKTAGGTLTLSGNVSVLADASIAVGPNGGALSLGSADRTITVAAGQAPGVRTSDSTMDTSNARPGS